MIVPHHQESQAAHASWHACAAQSLFWLSSYNTQHTGELVTNNTSNSTLESVESIQVGVDVVNACDDEDAGHCMHSHCLSLAVDISTINRQASMSVSDTHSVRLRAAAVMQLVQ